MSRVLTVLVALYVVFVFLFFFFFFQAEDGIRDYKVTGVQTCALPILDPDPAQPRLHLPRPRNPSRLQRPGGGTGGGRRARGGRGPAPKDVGVPHRRPRFGGDRKSVV